MTGTWVVGPSGRDIKVGGPTWLRLSEKERQECLAGKNTKGQARKETAGPASGLSKKAEAAQVKIDTLLSKLKPSEALAVVEAAKKKISGGPPKLTKADIEARRYSIVRAHDVPGKKGIVTFLVASKNLAVAKNYARQYLSKGGKFDADSIYPGTHVKEARELFAKGAY